MLINSGPHSVSIGRGWRPQPNINRANTVCHIAAMPLRSCCHVAAAMPLRAVAKCLVLVDMNAICYAAMPLRAASTVATYTPAP
jgi:hypothetical protein